MSVSSSSGSRAGVAVDLQPAVRPVRPYAVTLLVRGLTEPELNAVRREVMMHATSFAVSLTTVSRNDSNHRSSQELAQLLGRVNVRVSGATATLLSETYDATSGGGGGGGDGSSEGIDSIENRRAPVARVETPSNTLVFSLCVALPGVVEAGVAALPDLSGLRTLDVYGRDIRFEPRGAQRADDVHIKPDTHLGRLTAVMGCARIEVEMRAHRANETRRARFTPIEQCHYVAETEVVLKRPIHGTATHRYLMHACPANVFGDAGDAAVAASTTNRVARAFEHDLRAHASERAFTVRGVTDAMVRSGELRALDTPGTDKIETRVVRPDACILCKACQLAELPELTERIELREYKTRLRLTLRCKPDAGRTWYDVLEVALDTLSRPTDATAEVAAKYATLLRALRAQHLFAHLRAQPAAAAAAPPIEEESSTPIDMRSSYARTALPHIRESVAWYCLTCRKANYAPTVDNMVCAACGDHTICKASTETAQVYNV
jgi:NAD-dependent dihydropyrimidine dehydrogenase PreA subunit